MYARIALGVSLLVLCLTGCNANTKTPAPTKKTSNSTLENCEYLGRQLDTSGFMEFDVYEYKHRSGTILVFESVGGHVSAIKVDDHW